MTRPRPLRTATAVLVALALSLAGACGGGEQVGSDEVLDFDEQAGGRVGEIEATTTTAAPAETTAPPATAARAAPTTAAPTTAPPATAPPTTAAPAPAFTVRIVGTGQGFDPFNFAVTKGTRVQVVNEDSQARTFTSDEPGVFDSGMLAPGATYTFTADRPGKFAFHDETRPFAVGQMEVTG